MNTTVTIPSLTKSNLQEIEIKLPSVASQQNIVKLLDGIWNLIELQRFQLGKLDEVVKSRFIEMFGEIENPIYDVSSIGKECSLKSGTTFSADKELISGDYMYIKVSDMNRRGNEEYIRNSASYVSKATAKQSFIDKGAVIFPKRGGAIKTNKKRILSEDTCADLNIMGVIPGRRLTTEFLYVFFSMIDLSDLCDGATIPQLNNKNIAPLRISVPPKREQEAFSLFFYQIDKSKLVIKKSLSALEELRDSLMQKYFFD